MTTISHWDKNINSILPTEISTELPTERVQINDILSQELSSIDKYNLIKNNPDLTASNLSDILSDMVEWSDEYQTVSAHKKELWEREIMNQDDLNWMIDSIGKSCEAIKDQNPDSFHINSNYSALLTKQTAMIDFIYSKYYK